MSGIEGRPKGPGDRGRLRHIGGDTAETRLLADPKLAFVAPAFDRCHLARRLEELVGSHLGVKVRLEIESIEVIRHKPGQRCLLDIDLWIVSGTGPPEPMPILGKISARSLDRRSLEIQSRLWESGFSGDSADGISVPEPLGAIPELHMWLQRRVAGDGPLTRLQGEARLGLARRIAQACIKLHRSNIDLDRIHLMENEVSVLSDRLRALASQRPELAERLEAVLTRCRRLANEVDPLPATAIHRDFYPDQLVLDGERLHVVDFDLACIGDPALDIGNFLGHLIEYGLRTSGDPDAFSDVGDEMTQTFADHHADRRAVPAIEAYVLMTLARHIEISTRFVERKPFTEHLLELCESRLGIASTGRAEVLTR